MSLPLPPVASFLALLAPLQPEHLGMLTLAYNVADAPGRAALAQQLLRTNFGYNATLEQINLIYDRLLQQCPASIAVTQAPASGLALRPDSHEALQTLPYAPAWQKGVCPLDGGVLFRWQCIPTNALHSLSACRLDTCCVCDAVGARQCTQVLGTGRRCEMKSSFPAAIIIFASMPQHSPAWTQSDGSS